MPSKLEVELLAELAGGGWMPWEAYMARCVAHYYAHHAAVGTGVGDDFVTAPTLTPLFGATVAHWVVDRWEALGRPAHFALVEVGGGPLPMLGPLVARLREVAPDCAAAAGLWLVENSPLLAKKQAAAVPDAMVVGVLEEVPAGVMVLVANELLDALPVAQFRYVGGVVEERGIGVKDGGLVDVWKPVDRAAVVPDGVWEEGPAREVWVGAVRERLERDGGAVCLIDYGYVSGSGDTVQAMRGQGAVGLLEAPGEVDVTAHVDFGKLKELLGGEVVEMAAWLLRWGVLGLAEATINDPATAAALHRLLHPARMGGLFKVLCYTHIVR